MMTRPFIATDLSYLDAQPVQKPELADLAFPTRELYARASTPAITIHDDRHILACAGILPVHAYKGLVWAFLSEHAAPKLVGITRIMKKHLDAAPFKRLETTVVAEFAPGHRWMRMLGFTDETPNGMPYYDAAGWSHHQYSRVR